MSDELSKEVDHELEELKHKQAKELEEFEQQRRERLAKFEAGEALHAFEKKEASELRAFVKDERSEFVIKIDRHEYTVHKPHLTGTELRNLSVPSGRICNSHCENFTLQSWDAVVQDLQSLNS
jgi:hypothetical protein